MKKNFFSCLTLFLVIVGIAFSANAGVFRAEVGDTKVAYGETFVLSLLYEGDDGSTLQPDLGVLQNDFVIYETSTSFETQIINGNASQRRRWQMTLLPKKQGKITIPSIKAGSYASNPVGIEVISAKEFDASEKQDKTSQAEVAKFKAELEADDVDVFVQQAVPLTLKVYDNRNITFNREPWFNENGEVIIKSVGEPKIETKENYRIITFNYMAFPQKSGLITIPPAQVEGYYTSYEQNKNSDAGFFHFFNMNMDMMFAVQKPVAFQSSGTVLRVKPIPSEYGNDWWLPAKAVRLSAHWTDKKPIFKVGETVAREIVLTAQGVDETQMPELNLPENQNWKQYPEKPQISSVYSDGDLISQAVYRVVYIPQKNGKQELPELLIKWFNTGSQQIEISKINSDIVDVEKADGMADENADVPIYSAPKITENNTEDNITVRGEKPLFAANILTMVLACVVAFVCGILLCLLIVSKKLGNKDKLARKHLPKKINDDLKKRDYRSLRDHLILWGQSVFADAEINNLQELAKVVQYPDFDIQMQNLNENLYAGKSNHINDKVIKKALSMKYKKYTDNTEKSLLPELYK